MKLLVFLISTFVIGTILSLMLCYHSISINDPVWAVGGIITFFGTIGTVTFIDSESNSSFL